MDEAIWTTGGNALLYHQRFIEAGGFGEVHQMTDRSTGQCFARKILRPLGPFTRLDIENEMKAIKGLFNDGGHPNIVAVLHHGWIDHPFYYYFVDMELCDMNLGQYIHGDRTLAMEGEIGIKLDTDAFVTKAMDITAQMMNIWTIMSQIADGVEFIHKNEKIHRDLKPANVLYSAQQNLWKITDFGCTVEGTSRRAQTTAFSRGTASYRAPELILNNIFTNKVDIFALGCILYELATTKTAFQGDHDVYAYAFDDSEITVKGSLFSEMFERETSSLVQEMLHKEFNQRPSVAELREVFRSLCQHPVLEPPVQTPSRQENASGVKGWIMAGDDPRGYETGIQDDDTTEIGQMAVRYIFSKRGRVKGFGTVMQMVNADAYVGKRMKFSAEVKSSGVEEGAGLWMRIDGKARCMLGFDNMGNRSIKGTTGWQKYQVVLDFPAGSIAFGLGILLVGLGHVWFREMKFDETTDESTNIDMNEENDMETGYPAEPMNLDLSNN